MINNVSNNTISGSVKEINQEYGVFECTPNQFYFSLGCLTLSIIVFIIMVSKLIQTIILRVNYINPKVINQLKEDIKKDILT